MCRSQSADGYALQNAIGTLLPFSNPHGAPTVSHRFTGPVGEAGERAEGLALEEVPGGEEVGSRRAGESGGTPAGQAYTGWMEEEPDWEAACKGEA